MDKRDEKRCVIISGGDMENYEYHRKIINQAEIVICADAGGRHALNLGIIPDIVMGDMDTISEEEIGRLKKEGVSLNRYSKEKDYTDTHLALCKALELGYEHIDMVACLGGRFDHSLANVMLLALPQVRKMDIRILSPTQEIFLVKSDMKFKGQKGDTFSLLPLSENVAGINFSGLYYQLSKGELEMGVPIGVSNLLLEEEVKIKVSKGLLLGIRTKSIG